ncbi:CDP-alcohol phosphatidyltransferase family protein [Coralloluteibacterium stylophorae]|uniref:CDP-alcohol phosphatidyltransferase family protein n=1 Tax=Coralloluteibacterium stylophorae TaxID=1776034 RepID=UPI001FE97131|nr:CDP-alcohol phosphatidyltransferase family protein [Coralloluteibacterium stylophorae]
MPQDRDAGRQRHEARSAFAVGALLLAALAWMLCRAGASAEAVLPAAAALYALVAAIALRCMASSHPHGRFGAANAVTLLRAVLTCLVGGLLVDAPLLAGSRAWQWGAVAIVVVALALDGIDGWLARRQGLASRFGARFDLEIDALLILLLSVAAWRLDRAGAWVIGAGLMRYAFIGAGRIWPWLAAPLPPSLRRKAVCAVQGGVLCGLLSPWFVPPASQFLAAAALAALCCSFLGDVLWLHRSRPRHPLPVPG